MAKNIKPFWRTVFNCMAFIALACVGIALTLRFGFRSNGQISDAFSLVAQILAYLVVGFYAVFYCFGRTRRMWWYVLRWIIWAASMTLIIVFLILPMF